MELYVIKAGITKAKVDVIVNAANKYLKRGGGVCGAIFRDCNHSNDLQIECDKLAPINVGGAVITNAYDLPAKYIIHAVGPIYSNDKESSKLLRNAYYNSLKLADEKGLVSIAFPSISTGIFGYPLDKAARIAVNTMKEFK